MPALLPTVIPPLQASLVTITAIFLSHSLLFSYDTIAAVRRYNIHKRRFTQRATANTILYIHIAAAVLETYRWHVLVALGHVPYPDGWDVVLCLLHCGTNQALVRKLARGIPLMTRPVYQAGAIARLALTLIAWITVDPAYHRASIKCLNSFIYARFLLWIGSLYVGGRDKALMAQVRTKYGAKLYNMAIFTSAVLAVAESGFQYGTHGFVLLAVAIGALNGWVARQVEMARHGSRSLGFGGRTKGVLIDALLFLGYAELPALRRAGRPIVSPLQVARDPLYTAAVVEQ